MIMGQIEAEKSEKNKNQSMLMRRLLQEYNDIVIKQIKDKIPKAIMFKMVNVATRDMHSALLRQLYRQVCARLNVVFIFFSAAGAVRRTAGRGP